MNFLLSNLILTWFILNSIFPGVFQLEKWIISLIIFIAGAFIFFKDALINYQYIKIFFILFWYIFFIIQYLNGWVNGFGIDIVLIQYYFITPLFIITILLIGRYLDVDILLSKIILFTSSIGCITNLLFVAYAIGFIDLPNFLLFDFFGSVKVGEDYLEFRSTNQNSFFLLFPALLWYQIYYLKDKRWYTYFLLLVMILIGFLSGRRALQILIIFNLIIYLLINFNIKFLSKYFLYFLFSIIFPIFYINSYIDSGNIFYGFLNTFNAAFDSNNVYTSYRINQLIALLSFWADAPIFGNGLGSHPSLIASSDNEWSYEFVYLAFLGQFGVVGFFILLIAYFYPAYLIIINKNILNSYKCATFFIIFSCFVVGATNPFIYYPYLWYFNYLLLHKINSVSGYHLCH